MERRASELPIVVLMPRGDGHQFVCYADACSGVPGAANVEKFAEVNGVVARLAPRPEFICFPGDEIMGLTTDAEGLRKQWRYWLGTEMAWLDREAIPLYHTTGNHTTYDRMSEAVFREMLPGLPRNGPPGQQGLSYFVRRGDLLLVIVNTCRSGLGGEGRVESAWLDRVLTEQADARYKLVVGHHPVFPVNGMSGPFQLELGPEDGATFWEVLVRHGVLAYLCSHILTFDVQVQQGVLQILTAGAATAYRKPDEYLHAVQLAIDLAGLRYQVLDTTGTVREWLSWPPVLPPSEGWAPLALGDQAAPFRGDDPTDPETATMTAWQFTGRCAEASDGDAQTLLSAWDPGPALSTLWIGLLGREQHLGVLLSPQAGRSPRLWLGPRVPPGEPFEVQVALHTGMGPGGFLWRWGDDAPWSSMPGAEAWGAERLTWPVRWSIGHDRDDPNDRPFRNEGLRAHWHRTTMRLREA